MVPRTARRRRPRRAEIRRARRRRNVVALLALLVVIVMLVTGVIAVSVFVSRHDAVADGPKRGPLGFDESFDGTTLDANRWSPCYHWSSSGCTNLANDELEWYVPEQVKVGDGLLNLEADRRTVTGLENRQFDYVSGLISGLSPKRPLFSFRYGYVEARVKVPKGQGLWSAFWMLPATGESEPEVDIFETIGEEPNVVQMTTHWSEDGKERQRGRDRRGPDMTQGWHTYGLEWKPDSMTWYIDGVARWRVTDPRQIPQEDMYLLANLAVGGQFTKSPNEDTPFPSSLQFDYIRAWELP